MDNLRRHLLNSGYPLDFINTHISKIMNETLGPPIAKKPKIKFDFLIKIPFISEEFTRKVKSIIRKSGFNTRVVVESGVSLKELTRSKYEKPCQCLTCNMGIPCGLRNFVYKAKCQECNEEYIGASYRPAKARLSEHVASVRNENKRTTLGQHILEHREENTDQPRTITRRERVRGANGRLERDREDAENFSKSYELSIVKKCDNALNAFITEGLLIKKEKPRINNNVGNGYIV